LAKVSKNDLVSFIISPPFALEDCVEFGYLRNVHSDLFFSLAANGRLSYTKFTAL
jgi:hypothetical protein